MTRSNALSRLTLLRRPAPLRPLAVLRKAWALRRQRRALARLDAARLNDIGLTPEEARIEASRRLWDAPGYWR